MPHQASTPSEQDAQTQRVTLELLLDEHPTPLSFDEIRTRLLHPLEGDRGDFGRDDIDRAVRDLMTYGALRRIDSQFLASPTTVFVAGLLAS